MSGENLRITEEISVPAWIEPPFSGFPLSVFFHLCFLHTSINKATLEMVKRANVWDSSKKEVMLRQKSESTKKSAVFYSQFSED
jgi:hypothetical protein